MTEMRERVNVLEWPPRIAYGGQPNSYWPTNIDADLAARPTGSVPPEAILVGPTANDSEEAVNDPETWKANFGYVLDAMHTKWPDAPVYISKGWKPTGTGWDTINPLVLQVIAVRPWCYEGIDEGQLLPLDDNGATTMPDGVHPNAIGNEILARAWLDLLGYGP